MLSQFEIKVESPISNDNAQDQYQIAHERIVSFLFKAALIGDWNAAEFVMRLEKNIACTGITEIGDTVLHVAAAAKQTAFVCKLVDKCMNPSDLKIKNKHGNTAFILAAESGVVEIAKVMYVKNNKLPKIRSGNRKTPLEMAIWFRKREMAEYLYPITPPESLEEKEIKNIFLETIHADMYDISLEILKNLVDKSCLFTSTKMGESALKVLARKPLSDNHSIQGGTWERFVGTIATIPYIPFFRRIYTSLLKRRPASILISMLLEQIWKLPDSNFLKRIEDTKIFHDAAKIGNVGFLIMFINSYPDLIWKLDSNRHSIFHIAVINRQREVFRLIYNPRVRKEAFTLIKDNKGNNILHLAGKIAPPSRLNIVSGAALQMRSELLWFKEVEKIVQPSYVQMKNKHNQTPRELFTKQHEELRNAGEKWMKDTATSCMVVATLIATVVFAAAFTVPCGYKEENGAPIFLNNWWFTVFVISDALAMYSSTASILTFLSLFTAQYREDDFLFSLPAKLMAGLTTLFASIVFIVSTFYATFFLVYKEENQGTLPKLVAAFAGLPIILYVVLNCRLWIALFHSTFLPLAVFMFRLLFGSMKVIINQFIWFFRDKMCG